MSETDERAERWLLRQRLENEEGTSEEQEAWVTRLQVLDPYFYQSDHMLGLEDMVRLKRRVQILREQFDTPPTREQLVALVRSIDYSKAESREDIEDQDARIILFGASVPHPDAGILGYGTWSEGMSAEEVVDTALSWKVPDIFCLPGPVGEGSVSPSGPEEHES